MCLIAFALQASAAYPLLVVANRDELHARPAAALSRWRDYPQIVAGRDLVSGGTWLGVNQRGRFAALTNVREQVPTPEGAPSRGELVRDALLFDGPTTAFLDALGDAVTRYAGFNLLIGAPDEGLHYISNRSGRRYLHRGVYALSNGSLDSAWPKMTGLADALTTTVSSCSEPSEAALLSLLDDRSVPADSELPDTGVGVEAERLLGPRCIVTAQYGTRASTLVRMSRLGRVDMVEQTRGADGKVVSSVRANFQAIV